MILIAPRGLLEGPDKSIENKPEQILKAIDAGFDVEIDLWVVNSEIWLGHDAPQYLVPASFIERHSLYLWIHAKNLAALRWLLDTKCRYFWHENDQFTLTSNQKIWSFPTSELTAHSIQLLPELADQALDNVNINCYGVCSDYVVMIRERLLS